MLYHKIYLEHTDDIMHDYHVNPLLAKVIEAKKMDIDTYQQMISHRLIYHQYDLFSEAEMALERIHEALDNDEKICIYGDYDCDGILATAIMVQAFKDLGKDVGYHIPNRFIDGYGLNSMRVKQMAEKGYTLIITVDNGVKAHEAVEEANRLGIDVIITDHHTFNEEEDLPDAASIIHTKLSADYPFKEICGGFVAFKLASALTGMNDKYLYSLAAITTISDMMPLLNENRSIVEKGLEFMSENHYRSIELLKGEKQPYNVTTIGFTIAPKINSFGRLPENVNPNHLVKYFLKDTDPSYQNKIAAYASKINSLRQTMSDQAYRKALEIEHEKCLYYASKDVHEGIIGLIAGKYTREYERPALVMHYDETKQIYRGSARGIEGFNIYKFFLKHDNLLEQFGGHAMAGGFSVSKEHFKSLHQALLEELKDQEFNSSQDVIVIQKEDLTIDNVESLSQLEPYGKSNEEPLFMIENLTIDHFIELSGGKHLKMTVGNLSLLYFFNGDKKSIIASSPTHTFVGTLSINEFRGVKSINMIIKDIL